MADPGVRRDVERLANKLGKITATRRDALAALRYLRAVEGRMRDADRLADEVAVLIRRGKLDSRAPAADALLDYRSPLSTPRADRLAELESRLDALTRECQEARNLLIGELRELGDDIPEEIHLADLVRQLMKYWPDR